jgi:hypothetical protein
MRLEVLRESITRDTFLAVFENLVTAVNDTAEILAAAETGGNVEQRLRGQVMRLDSLAERIGRIKVPDGMWKNLKPSVTGDEDESWFSFRNMLVRRLIPSVSAILAKLIDKPLDNPAASMAVAKERVQNLQELLTGMAPSRSDMEPETAPELIDTGETEEPTESGFEEEPAAEPEAQTEEEPEKTS